MAYFPNGLSFASWQDENCFDCLNYRDNGTGSYGCAITDVHFVLNYHEGTNAKVLNSLIPDDGSEAFNCRMRLTQEQLETEARERDGQRDMERYLAAMAEVRAA